MKKRKPLSFFILSALILSSISFASCKSSPAKSDSDELQEQADTQNSSASHQSAYYESVIKELEQKLIDAKEEGYISSTEYKLQLEALLNSIAAIEDKLQGDHHTKLPENITNNIYNEDKTPQADSLGSSSVFKYNIQNGVASVIKYEGSSKSITVPSRIDGIEIKSIGEGAFQKTNIESVLISDGISEIDWFAFNCCTNLREISIPESVTSIGHGAFDGCHPDLIIKCKKGSYADTYAKSWGFAVIYV